MCKRAEGDQALGRELLNGAYELGYDFEARWGTELGLEEGWIGRAMERVNKETNGERNEIATAKL